MRAYTLDSSSPLPRYYQIYSVLLVMIKAGEFSEGEALPAERRLAAEFDVTRPTVVKALDLLERDGRLTKEQGRGNIVITPAPPSKNKTIAFVAAPPITQDLITSVSQTAFEAGYHLQILGIDYGYEDLEAYLETCVRSGVTGLLIYGRCLSKDVALYKSLLERGVPLVMVDRYALELSCDHVVFDNEAASYALMKTLLAQGHTRIAVLPGLEIYTTAVQDRLRGYRKALSDAGIEVDDDLLWLEFYLESLRAERNHATDLLKALETHRPTALLTINDFIAGELVRDLLEIEAEKGQGALVQGLELATFSNAPVDYPYPCITAVHPADELGCAATKLLLERIDKTLQGAARHQVIPMTIAPTAATPTSVRARIKQVA